MRGVTSGYQQKDPLMKKLKGFLEASAIRVLSYTPIVTTVAGGLAAALLVPSTAPAVLALVCILAGTSAGFVAGYAGIARAPERLTGLPKQSLGQDIKTAALMLPGGAVEFVRLMRLSFNGRALPKATRRIPAPAPESKAPSPAPKA